MNRNILFLTLVLVLLVVSLFQTFQLNDIKVRIETGKVSLGGGTGAKTQSTGGQVSLPTNLQNLPSMVGGC